MSKKAGLRVSAVTASIDGIFTRKRSAYPMESSIGGTMTQVMRLLNVLLEERVGEHGISQGTWFFIRALWEKDGISQKELADRVGTKPPTAFAAVGALQTAGFVTLRRDPADRRRTLVHLTSKGRGLESVLIPEVAAINPIVLKGFSRAQIQLLLELLQRLKTNASKAAADGLDEDGVEAA